MSNAKYEAWIRANTNLGERNVSKYTPEQLEQFECEREAKRIVEAPQREARRLEEARLANLALWNEAMYFYYFYPWKRLSMMFLNIIISTTFLNIILN